MNLSELLCSFGSGFTHADISKSTGQFVFLVVTVFPEPRLGIVYSFKNQVYLDIVRQNFDAS